MSETQIPVPAAATAPPFDVGEMLRRHRTKPADPGTAAAVTAPSAAESVAPAETGDSHLRAAQEAMAKLQQPEPKPQQTSSEQTWGSLAMAVGALGGLLTHTPLTTSLNAMAGVKKAVDAGDNARAQEEHDRWKTAQAALSKIVEYQLKESDLILKEKDPRRQLAATNAFIAQFKLDAMQKLFEQNGHDPVATLKAYNAAMRKGSEGMDAAAGAVSGPAGRDEAAKLAEGLGSEDPLKQADAVDQMRAVQRRASEGKGSTASTRTEELASDVRWAGVAAALRSGDPTRVKEAQQEVAKLAGGIGGGLHAPKPDTQASLDVAAEKALMASGMTEIQARQAVRGGLTITPAAAHMIAGQMLQGNMEASARMGRSSANMTLIENAFAEDAAKAGISPERTTALTLEWKARVAEAGREGGSIGNRLGAIEVSGKEAAKVAKLVTTAYDKLPRTQFRPFNQLAALVGSQDSSSEQAAALAADLALITAYARALNPQGVPRHEDIESAKQILDAKGQSPESHAAVVDQWLLEIDQIESAAKDARDGLIGAFRSKSGMPPPPDHEAALDWAKAHPQDPRAAEIIKRAAAGRTP